MALPRPHPFGFFQAGHTSLLPFLFKLSYACVHTFARVSGHRWVEVYTEDRGRGWESSPSPVPAHSFRQVPPSSPELPGTWFPQPACSQDPPSLPPQAAVTASMAEGSANRNSGPHTRMAYLSHLPSLCILPFLRPCWLLSCLPGACFQTI